MRSAVALALLLGLARIAPAAACPDSAGAIFADDFHDDTGGWDLAERSLGFGADGLAATIAKGGIASQTLNLTFPVRNASLCLDYVLPAVKEPVPSQGVIFWAVDYENYFLAQTDINRKLYIYSKARNVWTRLYVSDVPGLKIEPGEANEMVVALEDNSVTISINGAPIRRFRAQAPEGSTRFGLYAQSADPVQLEGGARFVFRDFVASKLR